MPTSFSLDSAGLETLFRAYGIPRPDAGLVLFGLRGCLPLEVPKGWVTSVKLAPAKVDHRHMRCTLGIWDPARKKLFAAPGSTVPLKENVEKAAAKGGKGSNRMEPGYYTDLTKGEHLQGKLNGHEALRQTAGRFYRRAPSGLPYTAESPLFYGNPYDNLHCGWNLDGLEQGFRSAGCMVVAGLPHCPRQEKPVPNQGAWKTFHDLLYQAPQESFPILLLPAKEALSAIGAKRNGGRLVFGSEGEAVRALQKKLAASGHYRGRAHGRLDARTYRAWNASGFAAA